MRPTDRNAIVDSAHQIPSRGQDGMSENVSGLSGQQKLFGEPPVESKFHRTFANLIQEKTRKPQNSVNRKPLLIKPKYLDIALSGSTLYREFALGTRKELRDTVVELVWYPLLVITEEIHHGRAMTVKRRKAELLGDLDVLQPVRKVIVLELGKVEGRPFRVGIRDVLKNFLLVQLVVAAYCLLDEVFTEQLGTESIQPEGDGAEGEKECAPCSHKSLPQKKASRGTAIRLHRMGADSMRNGFFGFLGQFFKVLLCTDITTIITFFHFFSLSFFCVFSLSERRLKISGRS